MSITDSRAPTEVEDYFRAVRLASLAAARSKGGFIDRFYQIGGLCFRLRFAGEAMLAQLTHSFEHLASEPAEPSLTVYIWDSASTGEPVPAPPWKLEDYISRSEIRGYNTPRFNTAFQLGAATLSMLDAEAREAVFWIADANQIAYYERGSPLRAILHWWTARRALQIVHAGAVGTSEGGVLLAGKGGMGKSTTTLLCVEVGLLYAGDDYVLLRADPSPFIYSLYNSAKLDDAALFRFPDFAPFVSNPQRTGDEKAVLFVRDRYPERVVSGFVVKALLIPRITPESETKLTRASAIAGLTALAPSTIFQLPGAGAEAFDLLARFAKRVPCYRLDLGTDAARAPELISSLLREI